jgi:hypothetical protein
VANFREGQLQHIEPGMRADVYVLSKPNVRFSGVVDSIGFGVSPSCEAHLRHAHGGQEPFYRLRAKNNYHLEEVTDRTEAQRKREAVPRCLQKEARLGLTPQKKVEAAKHDLTAILERAPTEAEVVDKLGMDVGRWRAIMQGVENMGPVSADARANQSDDHPALDLPKQAQTHPDFIRVRKRIVQHAWGSHQDAAGALPENGAAVLHQAAHDERDGQDVRRQGKPRFPDTQISAPKNGYRAARAQN